MQNNRYFYLLYILVLSCFSFSPQTLYANVELHLSSGNSSEKVDCNYIKIQGKQVLCATDKSVSIYELRQIRKIGTVKDEELFYCNNFTQQNINEINSLGSKTAADKLSAEQKYTPKGIINSTARFCIYLIRRYKNSNPLGFAEKDGLILGTLLKDDGLLLGTLLGLIGAVWFLIAAFRTGFLWGLGSFFLPFVAVIFLFIHWRDAVRPTLLFMVGVIIVVLPFFSIPEELPMKKSAVLQEIKR